MQGNTQGCCSCPIQLFHRQCSFVTLVVFLVTTDHQLRHVFLLQRKLDKVDDHYRSRLLATPTRSEFQFTQDAEHLSKGTCNGACCSLWEFSHVLSRILCEWPQNSIPQTLQWKLDKTETGRASFEISDGRSQASKRLQTPHESIDCVSSLQKFRMGFDYCTMHTHHVWSPVSGYVLCALYRNCDKTGP